MSQSERPNITIILNNIRSSENVGSIFRTADSAGVSKIILCGYTPAPTDRFGRENKKLVKASLGAEKSVEWEKVKTLREAIKQLKNCSSGSQMLRISRLQNNSSAPKVVAIEQDKKAIDYREIKKKTKNKNLALVFGNEVDGLLKKDLKLCDIIAELPMLGHKESLNVSVCVGVVLYSLIAD